MISSPHSNFRVFTGWGTKKTRRFTAPKKDIPECLVTHNVPPSHNTLHTAGFHGDLRRLCGAKYSYLGLLIYDYPVVTCSPVKILGLVVKLIHEQKKTKKHSLEIKESGRNHEHRASGSNRLLASGQGFWFRQLMSALKGLWNRFLGLPGELNGLFILRTHYPSGRTWANLLWFIWHNQTIGSASFRA